MSKYSIEIIDAVLVFCESGESLSLDKNALNASFPSTTLKLKHTEGRLTMSQCILLHTAIKKGAKNCQLTCIC